MSIIQQVLLWIYALFKKIGLLETAWFKKIFYWAYFFYKKHIEDPFFGLTQQYPELFKGGHILDVGANIGYTATLFSQVITSGFQVYAFEPETKNIDSLREILNIYHLIGQVIPIQAAVGAEKGTIELWHNETHHADHRILTNTYKSSGVALQEVSQVTLLSIDDFVQNELNNGAIKFIKIDVQGYELPVCLGMEKTLQNNPDAAIVLEYMPSMITELGFIPQEILDFFQKRGYFMYVLDQGGKLLKADLAIIKQEIKKRTYIDLVFTHKLI
ncbi:FkbM family methyltransferase [Crocosphaera sp.]|uniref:FkbM family methyltransferase n=1 Tax=Crocosphaera sp. TaxID=2729996 RepID=UPI00261EFA9E|nr:FkbM family methyltransferase [Crocosphaera sp.]MDJ0579623.1 FkbM family methyltransferase [Crocosphaera sp.]